MKVKTSLFIVFLLSSSCEKINQFIEPKITISTDPNLSYESKKDEYYGTDWLQTYDIYLPSNRSTTSTPIIILLHGGSWREGDKSFLTPLVEFIKNKKESWAIVNANYRLTFQKNISYKEQVEDIGLLVKKLRKDAKSLNISTKIYIMGISSGGHLGMLYAYSDEGSKNIFAVGGIVPPTDLTSLEIRQGFLGIDIVSLIGKSYDNAKEDYEKASPYFQINKKSPPTLFFHGGNDKVVPHEQGDLMAKKLEETKIKYEYILRPEQSHNWNEQTETLNKILSFGKENL